jgi:hypothetical protein
VTGFKEESIEQFFLFAGSQIVPACPSARDTLHNEEDFLCEREEVE